MSSISSNPPEERHKRLAKAAASGDEKTIRQLVQESAWTSQLDRDTLRRALGSIAAYGYLPLSEFLIQHGAEVNRKRDNEVSALFRAAENGRTEVVRLLLKEGAEPGATDRYGRTALHVAALKGFTDIVRLLLNGNANTDARDREGRTPLIHLAAEKSSNWNEEVVALLLQKGANIEATDDTKRTPLQWAIATGVFGLSQLLLSGRFGKRADVMACNDRGRNSLHLAAECGRDDLAKLLLEHGANPRAASDGGWTPLHNAAQAGAASCVSLLLDSNVDVNAVLSNGMTPLHWASYNGRDEVVRIIVERPDVNLAIKDSFDRTALLCAAEKRHYEICNILSPGMTGKRVRGAARLACDKLEATVVDFGMELREGRQRVFKYSVFDLLYGWDDISNKPRVPLRVKNIRHQPAFRWVHLPANNVAWVETLLAKLFVEADCRDIDDFKALHRCLGQEHRGPQVHARFMRTYCQKIQKVHFDNNVPKQSKPSENPIEQPIPIIIEPQASQSTTNEGPKRSNTPSDRESKENAPPKPEKRSRAEKFAERHSKKPQGTGSRSPKPNKTSKPSEKNPKPGGKIITKLSGGNSKIILFIPFLHYETDERREKMATAIRRAQMDEKQRAARRDSTPALTGDDALIEAYLLNSPPLHVRRTLDQFFYHGIDTTKRDRDQVVYRYCNRRGLEPRVFMVDQCWLWILGNELIVTSFPQRWQQPRDDPLNVLQGIIEDMNAKTRPPIKSVYDLAMLITSRCSGMFDRHRLDSEEYQFLDMFEGSIGNVTNLETKLFDYFNDASSAAGKWLKMNRLPRSLSMLQGESDKDPRFQDALLDIGIETRLLAEIKDIRDELNMIRMVLTYQYQKLPDFADYIVDELGKKSEESWEIRLRSKEQLKVVKMHIDDVERMDRQADGIYQSLLSLLDLKQKHANAFEARFGRDQAAFSARSSKTILVFTIVTIIFLPLSFIAAFFAINIEEFPHGSNGPSLPLGYVSKYTFGIGLTISLPLIALAFAIDDIATLFPRMTAWLVRRIRDRKKRNENDQSGEREEGTEKRRTSLASGAREIVGSMPRKSFGFERELSPAQRSHSRTTQISWARRSHETGRVGFSYDLERGRLV